MKVILTADVPGKGRKHDIIEVSAGYAQNFLYAKELAVVANKPNLKKRSKAMEAEAAAADVVKQAALALKTQLDQTVLTSALIINDGQAMGSVSHKHILAMLKAKGFDLNKHQLITKDKFNHPGRYQIAIKLHPEITARVILDVTAKN